YCHTGGGQCFAPAPGHLCLQTKSSRPESLTPMRSVCVALLALAGAGSVWAAALPTVILDPGGVPPAALKAINEAVEAITRLAVDQDGGEVSRLRRRAHQATLSALETQGYFSPVVTLEVGKDVGGETWDIIIKPGERTLVR